MKCVMCKSSENVRQAIVGGIYYRQICNGCVADMQSTNSFSSGFQGFDRRRQYEDHAQDTVQPWDAMGKPRAEFYRLYPRQALKLFSKDEIEQIKRQL